ncbi:MAG: 50S ribosomal protein L18 [Armatimonadetes bacterium]|nr:50S ribosomal protein L18 [Candidatus Hippobium faecium]
MKQTKEQLRQKRHLRIRKNLSGTEAKPRLNVFRSLKGIYAQIIDDTKGITLVSSSTLDEAVKSQIAGKNKTEVAKIVGLTVGKKAVEAGISEVVFDRAGYKYHGRVASLADGAREAGLKF